MCPLYARADTAIKTKNILSGGAAEQDTGISPQPPSQSICAAKRPYPAGKKRIADGAIATWFSPPTRALCKELARRGLPFHTRGPSRTNHRARHRLREIVASDVHSIAAPVSIATGW
jgi:hypothetical protein